MLWIHLSKTFVTEGKTDVWKEHSWQQFIFIILFTEKKKLLKVSYYVKTRSSHRCDEDDPHLKHSLDNFPSLPSAKRMQLIH